MTLAATERPTQPSQTSTVEAVGGNDYGPRDVPTLRTSKSQSDLLQQPVLLPTLPQGSGDGGGPANRHSVTIALQDDGAAAHQALAQSLSVAAAVPGRRQSAYDVAAR